MEFGTSYNRRVDVTRGGRVWPHGVRQVIMGWHLGWGATNYQSEGSSFIGVLTQKPGGLFYFDERPFGRRSPNLLTAPNQRHRRPPCWGFQKFVILLLHNTARRHSETAAGQRSGIVYGFACSTSGQAHAYTGHISERSPHLLLRALFTVIPGLPAKPGAS